MEWRIHRCNDSNCSSPIALPQSINTRSQNIYIPAETLDFGIYRFNFFVQATIYQQPPSGTVSYSSMTQQEKIFIEISQSNITANLVQFGTSEITAGGGKDLILDPGHYSVDSDLGEFNTSVSRFIVPVKDN